MPKKEIFKVQLPIQSTEKNPPALVYNKDESEEFTIDIDQTVIDMMGGELKKYFVGYVDGDDVYFLSEAPEQEW